MNGRIKAVILLGVMFGLGIVGGMALETFRMHHFMPYPRTMYAERRIRRLTSELKLSSAQEQALRDIFGKAHERAMQVNEEVSWDLADIHRDSVQAIRKVLTPDQVKQFDKMHKQFHAKHLHMPNDDEEGPDGSPLPPPDGARP